jgi:hypothetical protein
MQDPQGGKGLRGPDKQQGALRNEAGTDTATPEGLQRPRKEPYDEETGRNEKATQLPKNQ